MENSSSVKWAVVHRIFFGRENAQINNEAQTATLFITGVPPEAVYQDVKDALDDAGRFFGDDEIRWKNYYLEVEAKWIEGWRYEFTDPTREHINYEDLLLSGKADRRITLRLPTGMHAVVARLAKSNGVSLNQMIVEIISEWQEKYSSVNPAVTTELDRVSKEYEHDVTKFQDRSLYCVRMWKRRPGVSLSILQQSIPPLRAMVELLSDKANFVIWETKSESPFIEADLKRAMEQAVEISVRQ